MEDNAMYAETYLRQQADKDINGTSLVDSETIRSIANMLENARKLGCLSQQPSQEVIEEFWNNSIPAYEEREPDHVCHPPHYTDGKIEVIDYIEDKGFGFCLGNAIKYISRAGKKDPAKEVEDLQKAVWYINRRIAELNNE